MLVEQCIYNDCTKSKIINQTLHAQMHAKVLHLGSIITRSPGSTGKKCVIMDRVIYKPPLFIVNATSFPGFHLRKQMPHPPSFGMGHQTVYLI